MNYSLINNEEKKQYEFHIDGAIARIEYIKALGKIFLTHTEVPAKFEGKGIGSALVKQVLDDIRQKDWYWYHFARLFRRTSIATPNTTHWLQNK